MRKNDLIMEESRWKCKIFYSDKSSCSRITWFKDYFAEHDPPCRKVQLKLKETASPRVKLYGNVTCLFQHKVRYVREMDRLPVELIPAGAEINLCVGEDLKKMEECVEKKFCFHVVSIIFLLSSIGCYASNDCRKYRNECWNIWILSPAMEYNNFFEQNK